MNRQEIFNKVVIHLLRQGESAVVFTQQSYGMLACCAYRSPDGNKCAIGCLIPHWLYNQSFELHRVDHEELEPVRRYLGVESPEDLKFLENLQHIHDTKKSETWYAEFEEFAVQSGLTMPNDVLHSKGPEPVVTRIPDHDHIPQLVG